MLESYHYIIIEILICSILTFLILFYYARKGTNKVVLITAYISWFLNFNYILLLPFDIYYYTHNVGTKQEIPEITESIINIGYNIIYWILYVFSWIFIPLMQCYEKSGEFTKIGKLKSSLKANLIYYTTLLGIMVIIIFYIIFSFGRKTFLNLFNALKNFSLLYGILIFFFLLSYSLVKMPKTLYAKMNLKKQIKYYEWRAIQYYEKLDGTKFSLINLFTKLKNTINKIKNKEENTLLNKKGSLNISSSTIEEDKKNAKKKENSHSSLDWTEPKPKTIEDYLEYMEDLYNEFSKNASKYGIDIVKDKIEIENDNEEEKNLIKNINELTILNRKAHKKMQNNSRMKYRIKNCYQHWAILNTIFFYKRENIAKDNKDIDYKKIEDNNNNINSNNNDNTNNNINNNDITIDIEYNLEKEGFIPLDNFSNIKIFYYTKVKICFYFISLIFLVITGLIAVTFEVLMMKPKFIHFIQFSLSNILISHLVILIPFLYLISMSLHTLFKIKFSNYIYMYSPQMTDSVSLMIFCSYLSRVLFAICLNVVQINVQLNDENHDDDQDHRTKFEEFLGLKMKEDEQNLILLLCKYCPFVLILFIVLFFFNVPGKIANCLGFNLFEFESEERDSDISDGHKYLMSLNKKLNGKNLDHRNKIIFEER